MRNRHDYDDQYAREVVVCCEGAVSYLAWWLAGLFIYLLTCLLTCLPGWLVDWYLACLLGWLADLLVGWLVGLLARLLVRSFACFLACFFGLLCLLTYFDLLCLADLQGLSGWTPETQPNDTLRRRLVEFLVFNLLALVCFELARLSLFLGLLAYFTLVWFVGLEGLFCFCLLALLCFDCLCWFACLVCFALQWYALLDLVSFS